MAPVSRAIVAGGGIGGLTAALALEQQGVDVTVHERAADLAATPQGGGVVLWHNAVLALRRLGLDGALARAGHELESHEFRSWRGGRLADWPVTAVAERSGAPAFAVSRPALHRLLLDAVGPRVRTGAAVERFDTDPTGVTVRFADGSVDRAELLVGADGLRSAVRRQLRPHEPPPRYAGYTAFQAVVRVHDERVRPGTFANLWGRGRRFLWFRLDDEGLVYWDGILSDRVSGRLTAAGGSLRDLLAAQFAGWPEPIGDLIAATEPERILPTHIFDRPPSAGWSAPRVVLIGDAAHPMTFNLGQGACQAVEDGVVLAACLARAGSGEAELGRALDAFEAERHPRTAEMVRTSWLIGSVGRWERRPACALRAAFMRTMFDGPIFRQNEQLMRGVTF
jgi:2-polyprenyl-6-methoxyphenol hydroxylase-like FAD-dependent oxidoreductase